MYTPRKSYSRTPGTAEEAVPAVRRADDARRRDLYRLWLARNCHFCNNYIPVVMMALLQTLAPSGLRQRDRAIASFGAVVRVPVARPYPRAQSARCLEARPNQNFQNFEAQV